MSYANHSTWAAPVINSALQLSHQKAHTGSSVSITQDTLKPNADSAHYQWQVSSDNSIWSDIVGATLANYVVFENSGYLRVEGTYLKSAEADVLEFSDSISVQANDLPPILQANPVGSIQENNPINAIVFDMNDSNTGEDRDEDGDAMSYFIVSGNVGGEFEIDISTGIITLKQSLNYEQKTQYTLWVFASANGVVDSTYVTINIQDQIEISTLNIGGVNSQFIPEGHFHQDTATITGNIGAVTWSKSGIDAALFNLDANTGELELPWRNFENPTDSDQDHVYEVTVIATDADNNTAQLPISISVVDINDNSATLPVDTDATANEISEAASGGQSVGITIFSQDLDAADTVTITLNDGRFQVDANGLVTVKAGSVFSVGSVLLVAFSDSSDLSHSWAVLPMIVLPDLDKDGIADKYDNDNFLPVIDDAIVNITENTTGTILDINDGQDDQDADGDAITYEILNVADASFFNISISNGHLSFNSPPDFESGKSQYQLTVRGHANDRSDDAVITINIANIDDESPKFSQANMALTVNENDLEIGYTATALDPDSPNVNYQISGGRDASLFSLINNALYFKESLDYESHRSIAGNHTYEVMIAASDGLNASTTQTLAISLTDLNDEAPKFDRVTWQLFINEHEIQTGYRPNAQDLDTLNLNYRISGGADASLFSLVSGELIFNQAQDYEQDNANDGGHSYMVIIEADDGNNPTDKQVVAITLNNIDDNLLKAITDTNPANDEIIESAGPDTEIGITANAKDADGDAVSYSLTKNGGGVFNIHANTGVISLAENTILNFNDRADYQIEVRAFSTESSIEQRVMFTISVLEDALDSDQDGIRDHEDTNNNNPCIPLVETQACVDLQPKDKDGDGVNEDFDLDDNDPNNDSDGDGLTNLEELNLNTFPLQADSDGDGLSDGMEVHDVNFPRDTDGDGVINPLDSDDDGDGINTLEELDVDNFDEDNNPLTQPLDIDLDGIADHLDADTFLEDGNDSDQDNLNDYLECQQQIPCIDSDLDGIPDYMDHDSDNNTVEDIYEPMPLQDTDGDGQLDYTDTDDDNDGILDIIEISDSSNLTIDDYDQDGILSFKDADEDRSDGNNDSDKDGLSDEIECPITAACPDSDMDSVPNYMDLDSDNNGIDDQFEHLSLMDTDGDGLLDYADTNDDNDDKLDTQEIDDVSNPALNDIDQDGIASYKDFDEDLSDGDNDSDKDGLSDPLELGNDPNAPLDTDGNLIPDYMQPDSKTIPACTAADCSETQEPKQDAVPTQDDASDDKSGKIQTAKDGVGSLYFLFLLLTPILIKRQSKLPILVLLGTVQLAVSDEYNATGFYLGAGIGASELNPDTSDSNYSHSNKKLNPAWKISGGWLINDFSAIEGYYAQLGHAQFKEAGSNIGELEYRVQGVTGVVKQYLLGKNQTKNSLSINGKLGGNWLVNQSKNIPFERNSNVQLYVGIGLEYALSHQVSVRVEYDRFGRDAQLFSFNLMKRFWYSPSKRIPPVRTQSNTVQFASNSTRLNFSTKNVLEKVAIKLTTNRQLRYEIQGHADSRGSQAYNLRLSKVRAQVIMDFLLVKSVYEQQLEITGLGENFPIASNLTSQGQAENRRAKFIELSL